MFQECKCIHNATKDVCLESIITFKKKKSTQVSTKAGQPFSTLIKNVEHQTLCSTLKNWKTVGKKREVAIYLGFPSFYLVRLSMIFLNLVNKLYVKQVHLVLSDCTFIHIAHW